MPFTKEELEIIFHLATELTGSNQDGVARREILASNVARRIQELGLPDLSTYLELADEDSKEYNILISSLTIHTTSWFREHAHFQQLIQKLEQCWKEFNKQRPFQVWSAACSTGEEAYSFALLLESFKEVHQGFEYKIWGTDIDPISLETARSAVYRDQQFSSIPKQYVPFLLKGQGKSAGLFTLTKSVRERCSFGRHNLTYPVSNAFLNFPEKFDFIVCRNVLIYFKPHDVDLIISNLLKKLDSQGTLCLGHSEKIEASKHGLILTSNSCYQFTGTSKQCSSNPIEKAPSNKNLLIIDDSNTVRQMLLKCVQGTEFFGVAVGSAKEATEYLKSNQVDLITLDLHMPEEDGPSWLKRMRSKGMKTPVVIISDASPAEANSVLGALENGAQDYIEKGHLKQNKADLLECFRELLGSYEGKKGVVEQTGKKKLEIELFQPDLILLGASTGGTNALSEILSNFPKNTPPVLVVQHISKEFGEPFARRLSQVSGLPLGECRKEGPLQPGHLYLAFGDYHIGVIGKGGQFYLAPSEAPLMNRHRPSVDYLFHSVSTTNARTLAVLLTGMGKDGAKGLLELKKKGSITFAQDQESSVVFGMPAEAIKIGGTSFIGNLKEIRQQLDTALVIKKLSAG